MCLRTVTLYGESPGEILSAISESALQNPTLGILFSSVTLGIEDLASKLSTLPFPVIGCSTAGEILPGRGESPMSELSAVGCLLNPDPAVFRVQIFDRNDLSSFDLGRSIGKYGENQFKNPVFFIFISGLAMDGEEILRGISESLAGPAKIYGGRAGDDGRYEETFVFTSGICSSDGVAALILEGTAFEIHGLVTSGWRGVGMEKIVTSSEGNAVYSINNQPAIDLYLQYLGIREEDVPRLTASFPLIIKRKEGSEYIRTPVGVDRSSHALIFGGSVPQGSVVRLASSPGRETIRISINDITRFYKEIQSAHLLLLFSCMARHNATGTHVADEINAAYQAGTAPLIGFFSYGEIGMNEHEECEFHNETFSLVTIRQRRRR
ncbi:FIST N-terminal domain-containing protein [uncultured Methanospirillum sp.]|uniref:FIST signal transduction protein n=1 Tax=uncultured Methanospirillum sp. TaxID=262503 RepID=UPI0029C81C5D|nr:FIST N-terminal domain-containing protein [uncultured Methanospirillum sp.]